MFDIVLPKDNEAGLISMAEKLGWDGLCLAYDSPKDISQFRSKTKLKLISAVIVKPGSEQKFKDKADLLISKDFDANSVRTTCERGLVHMIFGLELSTRPDFMHHRNSGLNHISCRLMAENDIGMLFDFSSILKSKGKQRAIILGRMMQNLMFARKYKLKVSVASFATTPLEMRPENVFDSLLTML